MNNVYSGRLFTSDMQYFVFVTNFFSRFTDSIRQSTDSLLNLR